jgi:hypothetical protein
MPGTLLGACLIIEVAASIMASPILSGPFLLTRATMRPQNPPVETRPLRSDDGALRVRVGAVVSAFQALARMEVLEEAIDQAPGLGLALAFRLSPVRAPHRVPGLPLGECDHLRRQFSPVRQLRYR